MTVRPGTVYLVGAGPGDPGLVTVRGLELVRRADVVLRDRLVDDALVAEARPSALVVDVGKGPCGDSGRQAEINAALVGYARLGRVVVRLKGGDPLVFGRGWEEREACRLAGVPCEIVPGVSSAVAGPAAADVPLTLRGVASSVAVVAAPVVRDTQLGALATADTGVVLMGVHGLADLARRLIARGRAPSTPAAVIERATLPGQRVVRACLEQIASAAAAAGCRSPAVVVIGPTAGASSDAPGPLAGKRIVVTRPTGAAHELTGSLRSLGAEVISIPLIRIAPTDRPDLSVIDRLRQYDWLVFTSRHGVRGFRRLIELGGGDTRRFAHAHLAAVGPVTARELEVWGLRPDLRPDHARADTLARALLSATPRPRRVLFPCGTLALDEIPNALSVEGVDVERLVVYETTPLALDARARATFEAGVDAVLLASPSAATALGRSGVDLANVTVVCIGPTTARAAADFAWPDIRVADVHGDAGMIAMTASALTTVSAA